MSKVQAYVYVVNTAMHQTVSMDRETFADFEEARDYKARLEREYGQIGCHEVRLLIELFPPTKDETEEEFDEDEMETEDIDE
jgi:hypothetical protein